MEKLSLAKPSVLKMWSHYIAHSHCWKKCGLGELLGKQFILFSKDPIVIK